MKQLIQSLLTGETIIKELPVEHCPSRNVLIKNHCSLLSKGTEKMLLDFGKANILGKIKQQPDKVQQAIDKIKTDGLLPTVNSIKSKLDEPIQLGYSSMGEIIFVGKDVKDFKIGDRVISNGGHSEIVSVPTNLCAHVPDEVSDEEASFTIISSIGLQSLRLAEPTLGETFLVVGLGLIGLITSQLLQANGCNVLAIDLDPNKKAIAEELGIKFKAINSEENIIQWCLKETSGAGIDGVIVAASTKSSDPIQIAAKVSRKKGRIILLGVTGMELRRDLFYEKELTFKVSCSYGPGRYDNAYEKKGLDYPLPYVRWTEKRNFKSILELIKNNKLNVQKLISHEFNIENANSAYELIAKNTPSLGIIIKYPFSKTSYSKKIKLPKNNFSTKRSKSTTFGFIGAGNYAKKILIPTFSKNGANLLTIVSNKGLDSVSIGTKNGFQEASTNLDDIFDNEKCNAIVIATRHNTHAELIEKGLKAKKNIFVEKPLCLTSRELDKIQNAYTGENLLMVGYNRRFAPLINEIKYLLKNLPDEKSFIYTCNAGFIDPSHWTQDEEVGGGRLIGEACHFVDLLRYLAASEIENFNYVEANDLKKCSDNFSIHLKFKNGSIGVINYLSNGNKAYPKEKLEIFSGNSVIHLDNYRKLQAWGIKGFKKKRSFTQNKGQFECVRSFINAIENKKEPPIPIEELFEVQKLLISIKESL